jgi:hypothetical protein
MKLFALRQQVDKSFSIQKIFADRQKRLKKPVSYLQKNGLMVPNRPVADQVDPD